MYRYIRTQTMHITQQQFTHPGVLELTKKRHDALEHYKKAVDCAGFLKKAEKDNWIMLGYLLTNEQLTEAEKLIINEDLRRLKVRGQLERIKPKPKESK